MVSKSLDSCEIPDIVLNVSLQGIAAVGEGCVVGSSDVQLVKVLQEEEEEKKN